MHPIILNIAHKIMVATTVVSFVVLALCDYQYLKWQFDYVNKETDENNDDTQYLIF